MMWSMLRVLVTVVLLTTALAELTAGGPHNVVGCFNGRVTLHCNRNSSGTVTWSYIAPGTEREKPVPGRHSYFGSSYGRYSLFLEDLQRSDAGMYVCRSSDVPQSFDPSSAFVVVVAQYPVCRANYTKLTDEGKFTISCHIIYSGLLNLTLSMSRLDDNYTIAVHNYTSAVEGSWWQLEREVLANLTGHYVCRAKFYSSKTDIDIAKNQPKYIEAQCEPQLPEYRPTTPGGRITSAALASVIVSSIVAVLVPVVVVIFVVFIRRRKVKKQKRVRQSADVQLASSSLISRADCVSADKGTSMTFDDVDSKSQPHSSTDNTNGISPKHGGPSNNNNHLEYESDSVVSQCTDDDTNEDTIVPTAGRELAQAVMAART